MCFWHCRFVASSASNTKGASVDERSQPLASLWSNLASERGTQLERNQESCKRQEATGRSLQCSETTILRELPEAGSAEVEQLKMTSNTCADISQEIDPSRSQLVIRRDSGSSMDDSANTGEQQTQVRVPRQKRSAGR
jgi:hypothetical protein